jgi:hypothetical protein
MTRLGKALGGSFGISNSGMNMLRIDGIGLKMVSYGMCEYVVSSSS